MPTVNRLDSVGNLSITNTGIFDEVTPIISAGSLSFNGSSQYLTVGSTTDFQFLHDDTSDFTIEAWIYPTSVSTTIQPAIITTAAISSNIGVAFYIGNFNDGDIGLYFFNGSTGSLAGRVTGANAVVLNVWQHIAVTFTASTKAIAIYVNGIAKTTTVVGTDPAVRSYSSSPSSYVMAIGRQQYATPSGYFSGYMSNLRITKSIVYSSNFTPPTSILTSITNTSLLLKVVNSSSYITDSSPNAFTVTNNGSVTYNTASPYGASGSVRTISNTVYQISGTLDEISISPLNQYSASFNGANQYFTTSDNAALQFGTSDFTVEAWVYLNSLTFSSTQKRFWSYQGAGSNTVLWVGVTSGLKFSGEMRSSIGSNDIQILGTTSVQGNTWYHVAFARKGTTATLYVNGVAEGSNTSMNQSLDSGNPAIGAYYNTSGAGSPGDFWSGYISNLRLLKGRAVYTSNFNPPTAPLTAIANTSLLTCQNATIIDNSPNALALTNNGAVTTYNSPNPGFYSNLFDGSSKYLSVPNGAVSSLGTATDFTLEAWIYPTTLTPGGGGLSNGIALFGAYGATGTITGFSFFVLDTGALFFSSYIAATQQYLQATDNFVTTNKWQHVAITRSGSTYRMFVNGVSVTFTGSITQSLDTTNPVNIGGLVFNTYYDYFTGYISNARILKGTALYTANFTPPYTQLPVIANTSLLTCQSSTIIDKSPNAFTITNNGGVTIIPPPPYNTVMKQFSNGDCFIEGIFDETVTTLT